MNKTEYQISKHPIKDFEKLIYFCSADGTCKISEVPDSQVHALNDLLNSKGAEGWELVQLFFNKEGIIAFWKRFI